MVLGLLIEVGDEPHQEFNKVVQALNKIPCKDDKTCLSKEIKRFYCSTVPTSFSETLIGTLVPNYRPATPNLGAKMYHRIGFQVS